MAWNSFFIPVDMVGPVLTRWTRFWSKMTVLTRNGMKLIFYPGRHGLTRIDTMESVLTENDDFDWNGLKTHFLHWSTWFDRIDPVGSVLTRNSMKLIFILVNMVWPVLTWWTRFWPKMMVLTRNGLKTYYFTLIDMVWPVFTQWNWFLWKNAVDSRKIYFWILNFFYFFGFL